MQSFSGKIIIISRIASYFMHTAVRLGIRSTLNPLFIEQLFPDFKQSGTYVKDGVRRGGFYPSKRDKSFSTVQRRISIIIVVLVFRKY